MTPHTSLQQVFLAVPSNLQEATPFAGTSTNRLAASFFSRYGLDNFWSFLADKANKLQDCNQDQDFIMQVKMSWEKEQRATWIYRMTPNLWKDESCLHIQQFSNFLPIPGCIWAKENEGTVRQSGWGQSSSDRWFRTLENCGWYIDYAGPSSSENPWLPFPAGHHLQVDTSWWPKSHQDATWRRTPTNWWHSRDKWSPHFVNIWKILKQTHKTTFLEFFYFFSHKITLCFLLHHTIKYVQYDLYQPWNYEIWFS